MPGKPSTLFIYSLPLLYFAGIPATCAWVAAWTAAGLSFHQWRTKQEEQYVQRLQYLVDRKERRDKWDRLYFNGGDSAAAEETADH